MVGVICDFHWANTTHAMVICQGVKEIWKNSEWWQIIKKLKGLKTSDFLYALSSAMTCLDFEDLCIKMWGVWRDRCTATHNPKHDGPLYKSNITSHQTEAFTKAFRRAQESVPPRTWPLTQKYAPVPDKDHKKNFKIYVDAAYNKLSLNYPTGFAIYTPEGKLWWWATTEYPHWYNYGGRTTSYPRWH